ncbi:uncharacterized protein BDW43DRAFT_286745 [Aspergillus alliaceus]|uniref:uncharacterized protein n=1 Tax=Petromyces alliaceus TaxID=209559 RepID=UPI0012A63A9E|nr:uncharacterized protein BDW43DRAFT_286745 [Aspergillus alliaceus]KAB8230094.1 hypothetical protein BDW43DRAFT_286745 [Aspergillus alliaceus]
MRSPESSRHFGTNMGRRAFWLFFQFYFHSTATTCTLIQGCRLRPCSRALTSANVSNCAKLIPKMSVTSPSYISTYTPSLGPLHESTKK